METAILTGVILFLALMFYVGFKKGFIKILLSLIATVIAFILAIVLAGPVETYIKEKTPLYDSLKKQMTEYVEKYVEDSVDMAGLDSQKEAIKELKLPSSIQDKLIDDNTAEMKLDMGVASFSEYLAASLADILIQAATVLILFIIIKIILKVLISVLNVISHLPLINELNKSLGGVFGLVEGVCILWVVCLALTAISGTEMGEQVLSAISSNNILNFIYSNNIIMKILL